MITEMLLIVIRDASVGAGGEIQRYRIMDAGPSAHT